MSKELEALESLFNDYKIMCEDTGSNEHIYQECNLTSPYNIVKQALQRLEAIDNAEPSEALKKLEMLSDCAEAMKEAPSSNWIEYANSETELDYQLWRAYEDLKQALLKAQEQEKVIEVIKEKEVDITILKSAITFDEYNRIIKFKNFFALPLTQEEFELLKRWLS